MSNTETRALQFWPENGCIIFDPWSNQEQSETIHGHGHTRWAESIFDNWQASNFSKPAVFDWSEETVYIVGRGESLDWAAKHLNKKKRKGPALFLNHACMNESVKIKTQDFVMVVDDRAEKTILRDVSELRLIGCPALKKSFVEMPWKERYGFNLWPNAPLNRFMRRLFPHLPAVNEMLSVSVCALHLAVMNGAKKVVFVGHDHTHIHGKLKFTWENGESAKTTPYLAKLTQAIGMMAYFINENSDVQMVNCSKVPMVGHNMLAKGKIDRFEFIKQGHLPNYIE